MVAPLLIIGGVSAGIITALDVAAFVNDWRVTLERNAENQRYWNDYKKNTGITPLYPHRAGSYYDEIGTFLDASQGAVSLYGNARGRFGGMRDAD